MIQTPRFSRDTLSRLNTEDYWLALNPELTISEYPFERPAPALDVSAMDADRYVQQMRREGHFMIDRVLPRSEMERMARAVEVLVGQGFPPAFVYVYDEFWQVFRNLRPLLGPVFGDDYRLVTNLWAWHIPATGEDAGFGPHRDLTGAPAMRADGLPLIATVWIPLTDVSTFNSCMYLLPQDKDPNIPHNMTARTVPRESIQNIRALPARAGSIMSWNMNVLHWGSRSSEWAAGPRISIAAYLKRAEEPIFNSISLEPIQRLTLEFRLAVIGLVMSHYDKDAISDERYPRQLIEYCEPLTRYFQQPPEPAAQAEKPRDPPAAKVKVGRNEPCPCGSGKKYKRCHGAA